MTALDEMVWALLQEAAQVYGSERIQPLLGRLDEPLRIGVAGGPKSGKSTLINTFLGDRVAPVDVGQTFTWYQDGPAVGMTAYCDDGTVQPLPLSRGSDGTWAHSGGQQLDGIEDLVVSWPSRVLRHVSLVDSRPDCFPSNVDALLYLDASDFHPLEAAIAVSAVTRAAPVDVIGVLSRADEIGGGRVDALLSARQLARSLSREPSVSAASVTVVAVSGLLAQAGLALSEMDFEVLAEMAALPREELDSALLSADRFVARRGGRELLSRLGVHGLRLATTLIRTGTGTRHDLAAELVRRSGLPELQDVLNYHVIERRDILKSRSALVALESLFTSHPRGDLMARLERVLASAHEFRELRLLAALRNSAVAFASGLDDEARRLTGGDGTSPEARLGIEHEAAPDEIWELATAALRRWQDQADDPRLTSQQRRAARVVARSCEGLLHGLS